MHINSWFFYKNPSFFNGNTLEQRLLLGVQLHVAYLFNPKFWVLASIGQEIRLL